MWYIYGVGNRFSKDPKFGKSSTIVPVRLGEDILTRLDATRGTSSRSDIIRRAVEAYILRLVQPHSDETDPLTDLTP